MSKLTFTAYEAFVAHQKILETRTVDSVVPEETDIEIDPAALVDVADKLGSESFHRRGLISEGPRNCLKGIRFTYTNGLVDIYRGGELVEQSVDPNLEKAGQLIGLIDNYFREWTGVPDDITTTPIVTLIAGVFNGKNYTDTNRHFDYKLNIPHVSFKDYFMGDPEHSSVYYPGEYRLPTKFTAAMRALGGLPDPMCPTPRFGRNEAEEFIMPAAKVCVEPWNAYHSGPTDKSARGTKRGILDVSYDLRDIPLDVLKPKLAPAGKI